MENGDDGSVPERGSWLDDAEVAALHCGVLAHLCALADELGVPQVQRLVGRIVLVAKRHHRHLFVQLLIQARDVRKQPETPYGPRCFGLQPSPKPETQGITMNLSQQIHTNN